MAENATEPGPTEPQQTPPRRRRTAAAAAATDGLERLTLPIDEKGGLALDRMRDETRARLQAALKATPNGARELGLTSGAPDELATAGDVAVLYGVVSKLLQVGAQSAGYDAADAATLAFTPEEIERLDEPTRKVINKYNLFGRWADEIGLAMLVGLTLSAKVQALPPRPRKPAEVIPMRPVAVEDAKPTETP